jgi:dTDP-glucose 4,6-dehydratase
MGKFKIFLTGITGFIGNRLAEVLIKNGHKIHAIVRYRAAEDYSIKPRRIQKVSYHTCNLNDHIGLRRTLINIDPEIIIHLAALSPVRHSFTSPIEYQYTNYLSTVELVHTSVELSSLKKLIFASTMETYGWQEQHIPFTEDLPLNPASPYAVSKVAAEKYLHMAGEAFNLPYIVVKPCNTFGRRRSTSFITEYLITEMLQNKIPRVGSPDAVRDMMYVTDHLNAYLTSISSSINRGTYNIGNGSMLTMLELAQMIKEKIGYSGDIKVGFPDGYPTRPIVDPYLSLNSLKAKKDLGWEPKVSINEGLDMTIDYWRKNLQQ